MNNSRAASRHEHLVCLHKPAGILQTSHQHCFFPPSVLCRESLTRNNKHAAAFKNMRSLTQKFFLRSTDFEIF